MVRHPEDGSKVNDRQARATPTPAGMSWQVVGRIVAAHGLKGWVRVRCLSDFPERLLRPGPRWLRSQAPGGSPSDPWPTQLLQGQFYPAKQLYLVQFEGIPDRTEAEGWVGAEVLVTDSDRPELAAEEYYLPDLIGVEVFHQPTGRSLGHLTAVVPAGNDLLEVTTEQGQTILIPFVTEIVPVVDLKSQRIEVLPPRGLLETFIEWSEAPPEG